MSAAEQLIPPEALTRQALVRCDPYRCTLTAGACVDRRAEALTRRTTAGDARHFRGCHGDHCVTCAVGAARAQVVPECPPTTCSAPGCSAPVTGAQGRKPLCPKHRRNAAHNNHAVRKP